MYVDKKLGGVNAVQTLSRLNRIHKDKESTFVLDFYNTEDEIKEAFKPYYQTTILSGSSDPNKLNDLKDALDAFGVYTPFIVNKFATDILNGVAVEKLHALLDGVIENIKSLPIEDIDDFKDKTKSYVKYYAFISQIITFEVVEFEELYQFLKVLSKKLVDLGTKQKVIGQDVLDSVIFDTYRNQKMTSNARISLAESGELPPMPTTVIGSGGEEQKDILENIVSEFNTRFGTNFSDEDKVKQILSTLSDEIVADKRITQSLQDSDRGNRMLVLKKLLDEKMTENVDSHLELYNNYHDNIDFKDYLTRYVDRIVADKLKELV
jgi:type I restriction enzyme R subunit